MSQTLQLLELVSAPITAAGLGSLAAAYRPPGPWLRSATQHLAAGLVFSAAAVELIPDLVRQHDQTGIVIGFALGIGAMAALRTLSQQAEARGGNASVSLIALIALIALDIFIDGLLLGVAFSEESRQGIILAVALTVEIAFLGLSIASALTDQGATRRRVVTTTLATASLIAVGGLFGLLVLGSLQGTGFTIVLAFGTVALMYLVTEELLTEAHEQPDSPVLSAMFFIGFLALLMLSLATT